MSKLIVFKKTDGSPIAVNPSNIDFVEPSIAGRVLICMISGAKIFVAGSFESVLEVLETVRILSQQE